MKNKKKFILLFVLLAIIIAIGSGLFIYFRNPNKLSASEKRFLADQATSIQNINVLNNVDVFGESGEGLYYDFLDDFSHEYGIDVNPVAYNLGETVSTTSLSASNILNDNEAVFYKDHYVLVGKNYEYISSLEKLDDKKIGVLNENMSYVTSYLNTSKTLVSYDTNDALLEAFKEQQDIQYIIVPLHLYLNTILTNDYAIVYHFGDMAYYYKISGIDSTLGSILEKYFHVWSEDKMNDYFEEHLFRLFVESLNISMTEVDAMKSKTYHYGFVNNTPYEILAGGNYGGIIAQYLKEFMEFSETEIEFNKYKKPSQLLKAMNSKKIDMYFGYYDFANSVDKIASGIGMNYLVIVPKSNSEAIHSLKTLENDVVYVEDNTELYNFLKSNTKLKIKTYKNEKELGKLIKKKSTVIVDETIFDANQNGVFAPYSSRYSFSLNKDYEFKVNTNETFKKLFKAFIQYKDAEETEYRGIYNFLRTVQSGTITGTIARYFMYFLIVVVLGFLYVYKITKRVKISKKIKKEDKLKYIDQLTSLKNRNYLSENLENWAKNTVYPQTVIVVDLNNLQYINDTMGYEQGDIQIKAAANILVKTQLDNSDIIRTDGNEFVIYLVGYQTKQITSYIHKLNKEFKKMPYEYGAAIGYSMILDDIKSVEDAMNEAVEEVKKQKNNKKEVSE